jgi:hypothetical protein
MGGFFQEIMKLFRRKKQIYLAVPISTTDYSGNYNDDDSLADEFYHNIIRTITWTEKIVQEIKDITNINYAKVLRTINPQYEGKPFYKFDGQDITTPDIPFNYDLILTFALNVRKETIIPKKDIAELGKVLKFEIDITTLDGAPIAESEGLVDGSDIPPIDTWFYITKKYLYCWIPTLFIAKMQGAIDVEILASYEWLPDIGSELNNRIFEE